MPNSTAAHLRSPIHHKVPDPSVSGSVVADSVISNDHRACESGSSDSEHSDSSDRVSSYITWKSVLDRLSALLLLIPSLPVIAGLILLVRCTSKGPGVFRQVRVGKDGRQYTMYKMRSMRVDAEAKTGPVWAKSNDPRTTPVGRFLRASHLDELPQLFNVLKGQMSLIGPRPERPEIVEVLAEQIPGYRNRLQVLPGITGLAQINLPPDTDLDSVRRKQVLDLDYIRTASLSLDLRIFLCTVTKLFFIPNTWSLHHLRLYRSADIAATINPPVAVSSETSPERSTDPSAHDKHPSGLRIVCADSHTSPSHPMASRKSTPKSHEHSWPQNQSSGFKVES